MKMYKKRTFDSDVEWAWDDATVIADVNAVTARVVLLRIC